MTIQNALLVGDPLAAPDSLSFTRVLEGQGTKIIQIKCTTIGFALSDLVGGEEAWVGTRVEAGTVTDANTYGAMSFGALLEMELFVSNKLAQ